MLCAAGRGLLYLGRRVVPLRAGRSVDIPAWTPHRLAALTDLTILEVSTPAADDIVRLVDDYQRPPDPPATAPAGRGQRCQGLAEPAPRGRIRGSRMEYRRRMDRDHRLASIAIMLASGQRLRASDLAARFSVSERTVYRDMQRLANRGFPLAAIPGPNGGYALFTNITAKRIDLQLDEAVALAVGAALAAKLISRGDASAAQRALGKIQGALPSNISCALPDLLHLFDESPDQAAATEAVSTS